MTATQAFDNRRPPGKPPLQNGRRKSRGHYRTDIVYRTFVDFAIIGTIVLMFLEPATLLRAVAALGAVYEDVTGRTVTTAMDLAASIDDIDMKSLPRAVDVAIDVDAFKSSSLDDGDKLRDATRARAGHDQQRVLFLLSDADPDDANVQMMRGIAMLALPGPENLSAGRDLLQRASDAGQTQAASFLGAFKLMFGSSNDDRRDGRALLERAADRGDAYAAYVLAFAYKTGAGGLADLTRSAHYLKVAADRNVPGATLRLAGFHAKGVGIPADGKIADELLQKAARDGDHKAQHLLGKYYTARWAAGLTPTLQDAVYWLQKAADAQVPGAMFDLGELHTALAKDPPLRDEAKGADYFKRCAALWDQDCLFAWGASLEIGAGTEANAFEARLYYDLAQRLGKADAAARVATLDRSLSPEQIRNAKRHADTMMTQRPPADDN